MTYTIRITWPAGATERQGPGTTTDGVALLPAGATVHASEIVPDRDNPTDHSKQWAHLIDGKYIATQYPNTQRPQIRAIVTDDSGGTVEPPPPSAAGNVSAHIELNIDGAIYSGDGTLAKR